MRSVLAMMVALVGVSAADAQQIVSHTEMASTVAPGAAVRVQANCQDSGRVTGGGFVQSQSPHRYSVIQSSPTVGGGGWLVVEVNSSGGAAASELTAYAICTSP